MRFTEPASLLILGVILLTLGFALYRTFQARWAKAEGVVDEIEAAIPKAKPEPTKDMIFAGIGLVLAVGLLIFSVDYPLLAKLWIFVVAGGFITIPAVLLFYRGYSHVRRGEGGGEARDPINWKLILEQAFLLVMFLAFVIAMDEVGFILCTFLFVFAITFFFERRWRISILAGIGTALLIYVMKASFGFFLPPGFLDL
jgi:hypothetical protein